MEQTHTDVISKVAAALGRSEPLAVAPIPPAIDEPITRLVHSDIGLAELFTARAKANKIGVEATTPADLPARLVGFLRANQCKSIAIPISPLLERLHLQAVLKDAALDARRWDEMTLDQLYDVDCGITDVYAAVAETGSLVIRASSDHGRALSLVPAIHVAIIEPANFLPDLVDLFDKLGSEDPASNITIITGPSKTSDIEMNLVVGVHGPCQVQTYILS